MKIGHVLFTHIQFVPDNKGENEAGLRQYQHIMLGRAGRGRDAPCDHSGRTESSMFGRIVGRATGFPLLQIGSWRGAKGARLYRPLTLLRYGELHREGPPVGPGVPTTLAMPRSFYGSRFPCRP
jgi:hypothetical protein